MRIGAFEIEEPLPELKDPHVFTMLHPWVDVGSVGTLSMARLERHYRAKPLGQLSRPGTFFDFTRYRPTVGTVNGRREITVPNTFLHYARGDRDYLFLHMLEPHMFAEDYIDSILEVLRKFNAKRMVRIGSMYDAVPHTRPLQVSGTISGQNAPQSGMQPSTYQGPTSIVYQLSERAPDLELDTVSLMVRLPHYTDLEEDFSGVARALEVLRPMYNLPDHLIDHKRGEAQYEDISKRLANDSKLRPYVERLESVYDDKSSDEPGKPSETRLPQAVEEFLEEIDGKFERD